MKKFALGIIVGSALTGAGASAFVQARVDTNGKLVGYIVQDKGREVCRDPMVWNQFRGPESYIVCE